MDSKFGKVVLVAVGVVLMLVFILPAGLTNMAGRNVEIGNVDGEPVRPEQLQNARILLSRAERIVVPTPFGNLPLGVYTLAESAIRDISQNPTGPVIERAQQAIVAAHGTLDELSREPLTFHLLLHEANQNGIGIPTDRVDQLLANIGAQVQIDGEGGEGPRLVNFTALTGEGIRGSYVQAAKAVYDVMLSAGRSSDFVKVSRPLAEYLVAEQLTHVTLDAVLFHAQDMLDQVDAPTDAAIQAQFEAYQDIAPGNYTAENPFGFGYRLSDRVRLEYLVVEREDVEQQVHQALAEQNVSDREATLYAYWRQNRSRFPAPTTQPTTQPAAEATTQPSTQPAVASLRAEENPEIQRFLDEQTAAIENESAAADWALFVQVRDRVLDAYLGQQADALETRVLRRITDLVNADYRAYNVAQRTDSDSAANTSTRVGVPLTDPTYLQAIADAVAEGEAIRPTVRRFGRDLLAVEDLSDPDTVGPIADAFFIIDGRPAASFGGYVSSQLRPILSEEELAQAEQTPFAFDVLQPVSNLVDFEQNAYVTRIIEAVPDASPESLDEVAEQVRQDLQNVAAYELALTAARELAEQAQAAGSLSEAAPDRVVTTSPLIPAQGPLGDAVFGDLPAAATPMFAREVYQLLPVDGVIGPTGVLELPAALLASTAQVVDAHGHYADETERALMIAAARQQASSVLLQGSSLTTDFFNPQRVADRVGFEGRDTGE